MIEDALSSAAYTARSPRRPIWDRKADGAPADSVLAAIAAHRDDFDGFTAEMAFLQTSRPHAKLSTARFATPTRPTPTRS